VNFITELTSNLATTAMLLPILAPIALKLDLNPYMLLVATTVAASCAFMLPVATPPNAVVFGSGYLRIPDMVKTGIWMNLISILILTGMVLGLGCDWLSRMPWSESSLPLNAVTSLVGAPVVIWIIFMRNRRRSAL
jgi:ABC-type cobalamin transport system permease subunit